MPEALYSCGPLYNPKTDNVYLAQVGWSFTHIQTTCRTVPALYVHVLLYISLALKEGNWASTTSDVALTPLDISFQNYILTFSMSLCKCTLYDLSKAVCLLLP